MKLNIKIVKIIKKYLKNSLNVKFLRKRAVLLTFWLFSLSTCEGVNFLKGKIESIIERNKTVKRKFYIIHICKNRYSLCFEQSFQPRTFLKLKILSIVKFFAEKAVFFNILAILALYIWRGKFLGKVNSLKWSVLYKSENFQFLYQFLSLPKSIY